VQRIYLDELGDPTVQPIGIRLIQLTIASEPDMIAQGRQLIAQAEQQQTENLSRQDISRSDHHDRCLQNHAERSQRGRNYARHQH
jgi:hypothetical protein